MLSTTRKLDQLAQLNDENKQPSKNENSLSQNKDSQTDSQHSSQSSGFCLSYNLANYVVNNASSQECFGSQKDKLDWKPSQSSDSQNPFPNLLASSQNNINKKSEDVFIGLSQSASSVDLEPKLHDHPIPSSQTTNYCELNTSYKLSFETPESSQNSQEDADKTLTENDKYIKQDHYNSDSEIDEIGPSDDEQDTQLLSIDKTVKSNSFGVLDLSAKHVSVVESSDHQKCYYNQQNNINNKVDKLNKYINEKHPIQINYVHYIDQNQSSSIGKSDRMIGKLISEPNCPSDSRSVDLYESTGKSDLNYFNQAGAQFNEQMVTNYYNKAFYKNESFAYDNGFVHKNQTNQYPGKNFFF